jgi:hypothetical protein
MLDTIEWSADAVTKESMQDVPKDRSPPKVVRDVLEAVSVLLGVPKTRWDDLKKLISEPKFAEKVKALDFKKQVNKKQFDKLTEKLSAQDFDEEFIKTVCVPIVPLATWCRSIGCYLSKTKYKDGAIIRPVASAAEAEPSRPRSSPQQPADIEPTPASEMIFEPDIRFMSEDELEAVPDLVITRPEVGSIHFQGNTDCRGLDLDQVIRMVVGEVRVYPMYDQKPPPGQGLNKEAIVTMYQCYPPNGSDLLNDTKAQDKYKGKIKQMTEAKNARFVDYDCGSGVWKFAVDHF